MAPGRCIHPPRLLLVTLLLREERARRVFSPARLLLLFPFYACFAVRSIASRSSAGLLLKQGSGYF